MSHTDFLRSGGFRKDNTHLCTVCEHSRTEMGAKYGEIQSSDFNVERQTGGKECLHLIEPTGLHSQGQRAAITFVDCYLSHHSRLFH